MSKTVCHISYNHDAFDDRIYWKELLTLKEAGYVAIHLCVGTEEQDFISAEGIRIIQVKRRITAINIWLNRFLEVFFSKKGTIYDVFQKAASLNADVYHYHDLQINALAKKLKSLPQKPKVIYDAHEAYHLLLKKEGENLQHKLMNSFYVQAISKWELSHAAVADYIITTDKYTCNYFKRELKSLAVSNIYNYSYFKPHHHQERKIYDFLYTGTINKSRGVNEILIALNKIKKHFPSVSFLMIGTFENDSYRNEVEDLIKTLNITENVTIHPFVPFEEVQPFYQLSKIGMGLFHRKPNFEIFIPIKLFEYMAHGMPVIFANHGPAAAIVQKEACGLLVDVNEEHEIVEAMSKLLSDEHMYTEMGNNGKKAVAETYNWEKEKNKLLGIYKNILLDSKV